MILIWRPCSGQKTDKPQQGEILNENQRKMFLETGSRMTVVIYSSIKLDTTVIDGTVKNRKYTQ